MTKFAHELLLEFVRTEDAGDSFAFRTGRQEYVLRGTGGGAESVELTWSQALLGDLAALHQPDCDPAVTQRVGRTLRDFLGSEGWARQEARLLEAVSGGRPVVVTLRSAAAELYALPWELLCLDSSGQHLGELPSVLVRYEWPETVTAAESPSPRPEGGRVLFAWSSAGGPVPRAEHLRAIEEGARAGHYPFDTRRDVLGHASYGRLEDTLEAARAPGGTPISVLHLLGHGGAAGQTCGLLLDGESAGESTVVDAGRLRQLLTPYAGMVRLVVIAACNGGDIGVLGNQLGSVAQALHQIGIGAVIASRFPLSIPGSNRFSETFYRELFGGPSSVESAFLAARRQLARDTGRLDWASLQLYAREADGHDNRPLVLRPYRGLLAFQPEHSRFFFGRDAEINEIINDLGALARAGAPRFLVVAGSSGTGKSSVVLAGAVPRMLQAPGSTWVFARMRPGAEPLAALEAALATRTDASRPLLLVVDQLEELFTQTESAEERDTFVRWLWALAGQGDSGVSVLVTLRVDFIGRCGEFTLDDKGLRLDKVSYDEAHRVFVAQMTPAQLEEAIREPAGLVGLSLEAGLARRMLKDVEGEPGALPLLQDTLDMLWQRREGRKLTQAAYDAVGGVCGALGLRADARMAELDEAGRMMARRLFLRLVNVHSDTTMDTRRRALLAEVRPREPQEGARFERILGRFVDERLLVRTGDGRTTTVEVAHEALIRNWRRLRGWVEEERGRLLARQELTSRVEEWKKHGALLNERQLGLAEDVARVFSEEPDDDTKRLLEESRADVRRKRRLKQSALGGLLAVAVVLSLLGGWGMMESRHARVQAQRARDAGRLSVALRVAHEPEIAISLLREVEEEDSRELLLRGWVGAAPHFASSPVFRCRTPVELTDRSEPVRSASFSADGKRIIAHARDGTVREWNPDGTPAGTPLEEHGGGIAPAGASPDGARIVTVQDGTARVRKADGTLLRTLERQHDWRFLSATFNADGTHILTTSSDRAARVWTADGSLVTALPGNREGITAVAMSADGERVITALADGTATLWGLTGSGTGTLVAMLSGHLGAIHSASFSPDGSHVVTTSADGSARVWAADGALLAELKGHPDGASSAGFSPDGTRIVTVAGDGSARLWTSDASLVTERRRDGGRGMVFQGSRYRVTTSGDSKARVWGEDGALIAELPHGEQLVTSAAFSAEGTRVVTVSGSRPGGRDSVQVWRLDSKSRIASFQGRGEVLSAMFCPEGLRIVTSLDESTVGVWTADGSLVTRLPGHSRAVTLATLSPDCQRIITASDEGSAWVWKADGTRVARIDPHGVRMLSAAFSADGEYLVTGSENEAARLWASDGTLVAVLGGHRGPVRSVAFSPDGARVITASDDSLSRVWTIHPEAVRRALWLSTRYCLSPKERMNLLGAQEPGAQTGYENCMDMVHCLGREEPARQDRYPGCLDEYRRRAKARLYRASPEE
ncbi:CHAT domain-containing protein [Archangium violaceum]|uniref:nSTAND1 domain-containing NTPase n=1 Tax=Archangium violaceum TaxID=83451 RepID=UPI00193AE9FA|nr:CHAT domain-containing protein [Archangium violaceum]QRK10606.1 CHAT domain-containing protein [Archangium violaceum]